VDGTQVNSSDSLRDALAPHKPGDKVTLTVENPDGVQHTGDVVLGTNPAKPGVGFLGVSLDDRLEYHLPNFDVSIDSMAIGGPSAGLAFPLSILDQLTPGDLTGGQAVAATGEIHNDGTVGEIGGIQQKVTTVSRAGVKTFFVPLENYDEAKAHAPQGL